MRVHPAYRLALALIVGAVQAAACEAPLYDPLWRDKAIRVAPDCSFEEAAEFPGQFISASHAQNIGNGLIGQVVTTYQACGIYQTLMVVDCGSATALFIDAPETDRRSAQPRDQEPLPSGRKTAAEHQGQHSATGTAGPAVRL